MRIFRTTALTGRIASQDWTYAVHVLTEISLFQQKDLTSRFIPRRREERGAKAIISASRIPRCSNPLPAGGIAQDKPERWLP